MISHYCELPVGYRDNADRIHRHVEFRSLSGREEELLAKRSDISGAALVSELLASCVASLGDVSPVTVDIIRQLSVTDRQYLLFKLRSITFGDQVQAVIECPAESCSAKVDIDFNISDIPLADGDTRWEYLLELSDAAVAELGSHRSREVRLRLPTGEDQEVIAGLAMDNEAEALTQLLMRCVISLGDIQRPNLEQIRSLPSMLRREIEQFLEAYTPAAELVMDIDCPECGHGFSAPFNIQDFFFGELRISDTVLRKEVHYLAYHYHWSESEIMAMSRQRRRHYIETLSEEIERMNDAAEYV